MVPLGHPPPTLRIDVSHGGPYAGSSFEISPAAAAYLNDRAASAAGVLPGEFVPFEAGESFSIGCPTIAVPRPAFIEAYQELRVVIDGSVEVVLHEHPRLFSTAVDDPEVIRGVPTYIPKRLLPADAFGRLHTVEVFQGSQRLAGPVERLFHSPTSGVSFDQIEDAHGRLVVELRGDLSGLASGGQVVLFTDPVFGVPTEVSMVETDGAARLLDHRLLGWDRVGDTTLFLEWMALGVTPTGRSATLEIAFPRTGSGLAAALYGGHTRSTAFRVDATVLAPGR